MKISFFDKWVLNTFYKYLSVFSIILTIFLLAITIDDTYKQAFAMTIIVIVITMYFIIWCYANKRNSVTLSITNSKIEVSVGDIFKEKDLKVIPFNEYFDTQVDDDLISSNSLNGIFINKYYKQNVSKLDSLISNYKYTNDAKISKNTNRLKGNLSMYKLGTICVVNTYLLTAFSHFDENNKAYLDINDYLNCLMNFWNEVDIVYNGRTVVLPILGSGITRFRGYENITDQELLEIIISTFKFSRIKFTYPSKVKIIIHSDKFDKINLTLLKNLES